MLDLVPKASANNALKDAATAGADAATSGVEGLIRYVITNIDNWIGGIVVVLVFFLLSKMAAKGIKEAMISKKGEDIQEASLLLVERITVITITTLGLTIALAINGLNFTAVIGAFSLGVGFALKDIIGNFISGVLMLSQDKFKIGHFIKTSEGMGKIVSIDTRATVLKAINGTEVVIPNQSMLNQTITNYSINPFRRVELMTYVSWNSDLDKAMDLIHEVLDHHPEILKTPKSNVLLYNLEDDSNYVIRVTFWVETGRRWMKLRSDVHRAILATFDKNGVAIDYPIQTLTLGPDELELVQALGSRKKRKLLFAEPPPPLNPPSATEVSTPPESLAPQALKEAAQGAETVPDETATLLESNPSPLPMDPPLAPEPALAQTAPPLSLQATPPSSEPHLPPPTHL